MKIKDNLQRRTTLFLVFICIGIGSLFSQENYISLTISGQNADCIVEDKSNLTEVVSIDRDGWAFYSSTVQEQGCISDESGIIRTAAGVKYNLSSYNDVNTFLLKPDFATSLSIGLSETVQTSEIWLLGTAANGSNKILVTVEYTDGSTDESILEFLDWYQNSQYGVSYFGMGRIDTENSNLDERYNFSLFDRIVPTDESKSIVSINIEHIEGSGYVAIFGASAYDISTTREQEYSLYLLSNSHLDTQWNWELENTIGDYIPNTMNDNFNLFENYQNFHFNFESAIHYMWMKEYYPEKWEVLKNYVDEGRWNISGGAINANDVMVPSAESIMRNFLYGQEFYKEEFGRKGGTDVMLPDCFGFPYSLPTLAKHCGYVGFHSAKLAWGSAYDYNSLFNFGRWKGVDGSEIMALLKPGPYDAHEEFRKDLSYDGEILAKCISNQQEFGVASTCRYIGPRGDRGGGLDEETAIWLEKNMTSSGPVKVIMESPDNYFASFSGEQVANLPVWDNELPMRIHGVGCYTSQTILKYWNRKNELLAGATEKSSVVSDWMGMLNYPSEEIKESWIRILWHQFHDDLTGTSIPKSYRYGYNDAVLNQLELSENLRNSVGAVSRNLNTNVSGIPVVVYNPLSIAQTELVEASIKIDGQPNSLIVTDGEGHTVMSQILGYDSSTNELKFLFVASVQSLGYSIYNIEASEEAPINDESLIVTENSLENDVFKLTLDANGDVSSIYDKVQAKELLSAPIRLSLQSDVSTTWPAWEITSETVFSDPYSYVDEGVNVSIEEDGPLRIALKVVRTKEESEYVQYIRLSSQTSTDRVDFVNEVNWKTTGTLLKAEFPLVAQNDIAKFDLSIGAIDRSNSTGDLYEVAGHQWADITNSDGAYGVSILNDCKYGWDKPSDNTLRLSLIHTPKVENSYTYQAHQDFGLNKFLFSFYRHIGEWSESTVWEGEKVNQPLMAFQAPKYDGTLGRSFGFASVNTPKVAIKALKQAEESDDVIIRVYELSGEEQNNVVINFPSEILSATEVNGLEEYSGSATISGKSLVFNIGGFAPKTFSVKLADPDFKEDMNPVSNPVSLTYNIDVMSSDSNRNDGEFCETGLSYPTELLGDYVESEGIQFEMGPREDDLLNAVRCEGQTISLDYNEGTNSKLYLLAASTQRDGALGEFVIDDETHTINIGNFAGSVGQWPNQYSYGYYRVEDVGFTATHRHNNNTLENELYKFLYMFKYAIPVTADVQELRLPNNPDIIVFAATLSNNENDNVIPVTDITSLPDFIEVEPLFNTVKCGSVLTPTSVSVSDQTNDRESGFMAIDNDPYTKWCDNSSADKWIELNFGKDVEICGWQVLHGAIENEGFITSDFSLQRFVNDNWVDIDIVNNNTSNVTYYDVEPFVTSKVRLHIVNAQQGSNEAARIYGFNVYGSQLATGIFKHKLNSKTFKIYPNPTNGQEHLRVNTEEIGIINIYSLSGQLIYTNTVGIGITDIKASGLLSGSYVVCLLSKSGVSTQKLVVF
ncbi:glycoside hydrolase family 38 C-terminal domain-containing protein [Plebeiibacterium sediminum]|uniref:T9SS type A sorting domain-containing protein n=1 Tax=Plebeiibacterium sediminum TaxID=2992112 RepID=A0AAE3M6D3_9BACT|nr:glycoside hydrolase family 38 C-terminal domain-containing protein [Plebeiobacterium sediminum]MCW3787954.1 T9SS type A sorting domain-containing protein [Plebeiobacterium sediminum]